ncbi:MAG: beta-ketoacyl-[acyl-carrier-protein] synthase family protein [Crocinitomicaceae bacterium]
MDIFITGYGVISSIGKNVEETYATLLTEKSAIQQGKKKHTERFKVGEIHSSNAELMQTFGLKTVGSRTALLGMIAAKEAFAGHEFRSDVRTGLISGTSVGGMDVSEEEYKTEYNGEKSNPVMYLHHPSGTTTEQIATELGLTGFVNTISTACSSAANAIMMGARMIRTGQLDRVIVGGTDCMTNFTISGFRSLMIFDTDFCRPFDESRKGLNLGEGAGFLVIESAESMKKTNKQALAKLSGWSNASDAFHQTASSPEGFGAVLAMRKALQVANLQPEEIDYINAHGTATPNNDLSESKAFLTVFDGKVPAFSSTKAYTGHTLAACGGIEAVIALLSIQHRTLFPNLNHVTPIEETGLTPVKTVQENVDIQHVLSNSFGFGGNNSTLIISKI